MALLKCKGMMVTINTDASFYPTQKAAGYAFWITTDTGRIKQAGVLKGEIITSHEAEFKCIINALHKVGSRKLTNLKKIIINTDSLTTINLVNNNYTSSKWGGSLLEAYKKLLVDMNLTCQIEFRHVKSHKHTKTKRNWVNEWCHINAKAAVQPKIKNYPV
jgi:ribonuclease HI